MTLGIVFSILLLDQLTKFLVLKNLALHETVPVIANIFHVSLVCNKGAAFGILRDQVPLFIGTAVFSIVLIIRTLKRHHRLGLTLYSLSLAFILAGALGNLIDRLRLGCVVDFLDFRIWPVFNIADSAITVGAVLLGLSILKRDPG
jgi:signal peptidase II